MMTAPVLPNDLNIARVRLQGCGGWRDGRVLLERSLSAVAVMDIVGSDEILLVPYMRASSPLSTHLSPSHFVARITAQLQQMRSDALVDPVSAVPDGRALRFTSHDRFAAWLTLAWLKQASPQTRDMLNVLLKGQSVEQWQRHTVLTDGQRIVRLVSALSGQGYATNWVRRLATGDCVLAFQALGRAFGFQPFELASNNSNFTPVAAAAAVSSASPISRAPDPPDVAPPYQTDSSSASLVAIQAARQLVKSVPMPSCSDFAALAPIQQALLLTVLVLLEKPNAGVLLGEIGWRALSKLADYPPIDPVHLAPSALPPSAASRSIPPPQQQVAANKSKHKLNAEMRHETTAPTGLEQAMALSRFDDAVVAPSGAVQPADDLAAEATMPQPRLARRVETEFGGLMFIINILLALKLYPDFTEPLGRRLEPSPLWLLSKLGVHLFGKAFGRDPLFEMLHNSGRSGALPEQWQVNPEWLGHLPQRGVARLVFDGNNVTRCDGRGFISSDRAARPWSRPAIRARASARSRRVYALPISRGDRWIACLSAFIRFRIKHAAPGLDISTLRLPAIVDFADGDVAVHFSLACLPLAVRFAGLDRNPGWLPSEGRAISFHFS